MHIILGALASIVTILYLLDRMGIDLGGFNPFYWRRRRAWAKKYEGDPVYSVEDPVEVAALLILGAAKLNGDISAEQRRVAQQQFQSVFSMSERDALQLIASATHLLGAPQVIDTQLKGVIAKNKDRLTPEQAKSMLDMMMEIAAADGDSTAEQREYVDFVRSEFAREEKGEGPWG
jgi:uncharacterized tellurite resistance protein B-like protein